MTEKKETTPRQKKPTGTGAGPGKVKGTGTVTPKAQDERSETTPRTLAQTDTPREKQATRADADIHGAFEAGRLASDRGYPSKPPKGLTDEEEKQWYAGYKSVANPPSQNSLKPEDPRGKSDGYRGSY